MPKNDVAFMKCFIRVQHLIFLINNKNNEYLKLKKTSYTSFLFPKSMSIDMKHICF